MTPRERMRAAVQHELPDALPWSPRIRLWYEAAKRNGTLPAAWRDLSEREVEADLGLTCPARDGEIFRIRYTGGIEIETRWESNHQIDEIRTRVGTVRTVTRNTAELQARGLPGRVEAYPLAGDEDYRVWEYIFEHTEWEPAYDAYHEYDADIGESGFPMISTGDAPFHQFLLKIAGYEQAFYRIADELALVERLLQVMTESHRDRLWPVILDSPAELILHGAHFSSQFTPPSLLQKYILPYYEEMVPPLHDRGISIALHADNDTSQILELLEECGFDLFECFVTAPMVPLTLADARRRVGARITLWGCIPSSLLAPSTPIDRFKAYVRSVLTEIGEGRSIILGVADNVMPDSDIERIRWVSEYLAQKGGLPL